MNEDSKLQALQDRIGILENYLKIVLMIGGIAFLGVMAIAWLRHTQFEGPIEVLTVRQISVVDENGTERILIGSPVPDPKDGKRQDASTGIVINDANGWERFGLGLKEDGSIGMGFDAPPGVGDPRNRERMNLYVYPDGTAEWRVLDNTTRVKARFITDEEGLAKLQFVDWSGESPEVMTLGLKEVIRLVRVGN